MKEIIINSTSLEIRSAIIEDDDLVEFLVEREQSRRLVGNVYLGKINAILPGIQAAFVDLGYEKAGFLHVTDLIGSAKAISEREEADVLEPAPRRGSRRREIRNNQKPIEKLLFKGQEILVQVTKEAIGTKGPRLSTQISLPGRFVVYMPSLDYLGVSRRIESHQERARLRNFISKKKPPNSAIIARTACEGVDEKQIESDINFLHKLWRSIKKSSEKASAPNLVHEEVGLLIGMVRDVMTENVDRIWIDSETDHKRLIRYLKTFSPKLCSRVKLYKDKAPIFDKFGVENEIDKTLERKIWLKKGGYITIDQTEALVAIDVNTGRYVGKKDQEETILETNLLAAREIPRQLRLRDIGGIIVIDFIDMERESDKRKVLAELRYHLRKDRSRAKAFQVSDLGLVEVSRKRVRPSLLHFFSEECPYCKGMGKVLSFDSLATKIERWIRRVGSRTKEKKIQLRVNSSLAIFLEEERQDVLDALERQYRMKIEIQDDPRLHREDFRLVSLSSFRDLVQELT
ncbi:MAG: Rne/Rng family ribonuclease [Candidatus Latescibacteria bacterium]|nr:Rne/Rng family ribonuclease [Candidatus Latescibacterota bacterium]NIM22081.1 Rne/Rng family ribonuclease [Candidatus Latescibacterota bacterium]NIM66100.1 Rne/Rng family ribonuclease [Candidatus Latescibacterota bacterium]NIO02508.1 Rne/Rng family ribonuclease [Candidatus Latescibacterota bacterium]NIO29419.1 Rne/Rng family ribonuclease [Candidatus Latescibacterota bacterium]